MSDRIRIHFLVVVAVLLVGAAGWYASHSARTAAQGEHGELDGAKGMLEGLQQQEIGLLAHLAGLGDHAREHMNAGTETFERAVAEAAQAISADEAGELDEMVAVARQWQTITQRALARPAGADFSAADKTRADELRDEFDEANAEFQTDADAEAEHATARAATVSIGLIAFIGLLFGGIGSFAIERRHREARRASQSDRARQEHDSAYRVRQDEFSVALQAARNEPEAHVLIKRHLERATRGIRVTVLNRNNSDNRLEPMTVLEADSPIVGTIRDAEPESCIAIRLAGRHDRDPGVESLMECDICGKAPGPTACTPSIVGGEVIGSVLLEHGADLGATDDHRFNESVAQAAPILANLRNLRLAETRAATDALTGLPNRRAAEETLYRLIAHAGRRLAPLSVVLLDLDHFKQVNDIHGHEKGDQVLAAVGVAMAATIRASDFAARYGGEEFIIALPDTDLEGAVELCEKLRVAFAAIRVDGTSQGPTASFGVATYPGDGVDMQMLVRGADRALYSAKSAGRDRVCVANPVEFAPATP